MDDSNIGHVGRPYGGCAILWHRDLALAFTPINTTSSRICAVIVESKDVKIVLINVYMHIDDNSNINIDIFGEVLSEISAIINLFEGHDFTVGGDFNVDFKHHNSRNLNLFKHFLID